MARLAEGSEDDFPDLATVIGGGEVRGGRRTRKSPQKQLQRQEIDSENADSSKIDVSRNSPQKKTKSEENGAKAKLRRRVLNQTSENPLLQPLGSKRSTSTSTSFLKSPKILPNICIKPKPSMRKRKSPARQERKHTSGRESVSGSETTGLSDFIVDDSSYLEESDSEDDVLLSISRPVRTPRKLMKGLRRRQDDSLSECSLQADAESPDFTGFQEPVCVLAEDRSSFDDCIASGRVRIPQKDTIHESILEAASSGTDEPGHMLSYSPSEARSPKKTLKEIRFTTPPRSPQKVKSGLISPKKLPRIPSTPHRQSMDNFWSQGVINEWNDEYSPRKTTKTGRRLQKSDDNEFEDYLRKSPQKQDPAKGKIVLETKRDFNRRKQDIAVEFLAELDSNITAGKVGLMAEGSGGVKIIWSKKLNTTAGRAHWKRETIRAKAIPGDGKSETLSYVHHASIELAEKVIDSEDRLLNTLAHEFCHLANFMVSGIKNNPHGKEFKMWAAKCSSHFGHRGIEVTTKHSYEIDYRYVWECTNCGAEYKRHSKSIDPAKHQCGTCKSKLVQTKPEPKGVGKVGDYQMFVKENMKRLRQENLGSPQKEIMGLMGKLYQDFKAAKVKEGEDVGLREGSPVDSVDAMAWELELIDLTSP